MISIEWDISKTIAGLQALSARLANLRPAWVSVLAYLRRVTGQTINSRGARIGESYAPLSPAYAKQKERVWPGKPILRASDAMFDSLVSQTGDSVVEMSRDSLAYGTRSRYARYHQRGTSRMPRRAILAITEGDRKEVRRLMLEHLGNQSRLNGFGG